MPLDEQRRANLANWEDRVHVHTGPGGYDLDRYVQDPEALSGVVAFDRPWLGDIRGQRALHLQCHIGTDTLSLARLGADVTGVDFSPAALAAARDLFARTGTSGRFVEAELYDAPQRLAGEHFDLVYTGVGAIGWLPDLRGWAEVVATLLGDGGRLVVRDTHPVLFAVDDERDDELLVLRYPYFATGAALRWDDDSSYVGAAGALEATTTYEWSHGLGEVVTVLLEAGLQLDALVEHDEVEWQALPQMELTADGRWVLPEGRERLPLMFTVAASKPPGDRPLSSSP